jgi:hypothetical protein
MRLASSAAFITSGSAPTTSWKERSSGWKRTYVPFGSSLYLMYTRPVHLLLLLAPRGLLLLGGAAAAGSEAGCRLLAA